MITLLVKQLFKGSYEASERNPTGDLDMGCVVTLTLVLDIVLVLIAASKLMDYMGYA